MAKNSVFPSIQGSDAFALTPSNTQNIVLDSANYAAATIVFLHNPSTSGTAKVLPAGAPDDDTKAVTVYLVQGGTFPLAVKRVYATSPVPPTGLIAISGKQNI